MLKKFIIALWIIFVGIIRVFAYVQPSPYWGESLYPIVIWSDILFYDEFGKKIDINDDNSMTIPINSKSYIKFSIKNYDKVNTWDGTIAIQFSQIQKVGHFLFSIEGEQIKMKPGQVKEINIEIPVDVTKNTNYAFDMACELSIIGIKSNNSNGQIGVLPHDEAIKKHLNNNYYIPRRLYFGKENLLKMN